MFYSRSNFARVQFRLYFWSLASSRLLRMDKVDCPRPPSLLWLLELTVVSVGCFESSRYCTGVGVHLGYFMRGGSLKAQGGISPWVPELDPKSLGDPNAGEPFLQVLSIGREAEPALPVSLQILPHSIVFFNYWSLFKYELFSKMSMRWLRKNSNGIKLTS